MLNIESNTFVNTIENIQLYTLSRLNAELYSEVVFGNQKKMTESSSSLKTPNRGNGADYEKYSFTQTLAEVTVHVPVPVGTTGKQVNVVISPNHLKVGLKGGEPIIDVGCVSCSRSGLSCFIKLQTRLDIWMI